MDDLDNFFSDEAANAFVSGIDLRMNTEEGLKLMGGDDLNTEGREA